MSKVIFITTLGATFRFYREELLKIISRSQLRNFSFILLFPILGAWTNTNAQNVTLELRNGTPDSLLIGATIQVYENSLHFPQVYLLSNARGRACCIDLVNLDSLIINHLVTGEVTLWPQQLDLKGDSLVIGNLSTQAWVLPQATVSSSIKGIVVRGDTIRFKVEDFTDGRELDAAEVLSQLPGVEVSENGSVTYRGEPVERILIEGQDVVRSQFDLINRLVMPTDLSEADIIRTFDEETSSYQQTLNVRTHSKSSHRGQAEVMLDARGRPGLGLTSLYVRPNAWQGYGSVRLKTYGPSVLTGLDEVKSVDFNLEKLRKRVAVDSDLGGSARVFGESDPNALRRRDAVVEAHAVRSSEKRHGSLTIRSRHKSQLQELQETLLDASSGLGVGILNRAMDEKDNSIGLTGRFVDSTYTRFSYQMYGGLSFSKDNQSALGNSLVGTSIGMLDERLNLDGFNAYLSLSATYKFSNNWRLEGFAERRIENSSYETRFQDIFPIYGIVQPDSLGGVASLEVDTKQDFNSQVGVLHLSKKFNELVYGVEGQIRQRKWQDRQQSDSISEFTLQQVRQEETRIFGVGYLKGTWSKLQAVIRAGWVAGFFDVAEVKKQSKKYPFVKISSSYQLANKSRFKGEFLNTLTGYDNQDYWRSNLPITTRELRIGPQLNRSVSPRQSIAISYYSPPNARSNAFVTTVLSGYRQSRDLRYVVEFRPEGFTASVPRIINDQQGSKMSVVGLKPYGPIRIRLIANTDIWSGNYQEANLGKVDLRQNNTYVRLGFDWPVLEVLHLSANVDGRQTFQVLSHDDVSAKTGLRLWTAGATAKFRGKEWHIRGDLSTLWNSGGSGNFGNDPSLVDLGFEVIYNPVGSEWTLGLSGSDLLNYQRSRYSSFDIGPGGLRFVEFGRLPGYVLASVGYQWQK